MLHDDEFSALRAENARLCAENGALRAALAAGQDTIPHQHEALTCSSCGHELDPNSVGPCPACGGTAKTRQVTLTGQAGATGRVAPMLQRISTSFGFLGPKVVRFYGWLVPLYERHFAWSLAIYLVLLALPIAAPYVVPGALGISTGVVLTIIASFLNPITATVTRHTYHSE
jgi:predicted RNA-binding Zn-ribbon protein involved in translation (DUF1610 family)